MCFKKNSNKKVKEVSGNADVGSSKAFARKTSGKDDKDISVGIGEMFAIKLDENPTTGYQWAINISDEGVVVFQISTYFSKQTDIFIAGSGGTKVMAFKGVKAGTSKITLKYEQSWDKNSLTDTLIFNITVK